MEAAFAEEALAVARELCGLLHPLPAPRNMRR